MTVGIGDIAYSFYVASQVYGRFDGFQLDQGQANCSNSYSLFVLGANIFNYIFVEIGLVVLFCLWFIFDFREIEGTGHC